MSQSLQWENPDMNITQLYVETFFEEILQR